MNEGQQIPTATACNVASLHLVTHQAPLWRFYHKHGSDSLFSAFCLVLSRWGHSGEAAEILSCLFLLGQFQGNMHRAIKYLWVFKLWVFPVQWSHYATVILQKGTQHFNRDSQSFLWLPWWLIFIFSSSYKQQCRGQRGWTDPRGVSHLSWQVPPPCYAWHTRLCCRGEEVPEAWSRRWLQEQLGLSSPTWALPGLLSLSRREVCRQEGSTGSPSCAQLLSKPACSSSVEEDIKATAHGKDRWGKPVCSQKCTSEVQKSGDFYLF